ncbi:hypothetical protein TH53_04915 [Pedobacter lusitanus]|uniref:Outer membrane protein beta-barrel domain-containing protein n=1 Tax=Pedobacter lusitanus TaxID=1503925 RepID=A0A0D0G078_9SPHI|nr:outer membrane beta-barrel protein [Pedobacter lusitanus]KIO78199.1 hypothetical protein TH53_04915 [Pedobacter lusitanus]
MNKDNDIDQLFKDGLSDPEIPFNEMDWEKMERKLAMQEKKRVIPAWVYTASGIAAVLMISLYLYFSAPVSSDKQVIKDPLTNHRREPGKESAPVITRDSLNGQPLEKSGEELTGNNAEGILFSKSDLVDQERGLPKELPDSNAVTLIVPVLNSASSLWPQPAIVVPALPEKNFAVSAKSPQPVRVETDSAALVRKANALANSRDPFEKADAEKIARSVKAKMESALQPQNDLILSAMAAPDMSFAKSSKPSKVSSNVGVLATYAFTPKISMTSGAIYSRKFYNSGGTTPQNNSYMPGSDWQVSADCNVLDVPLNVNYKIFNRKKLSVSVNTGLSSYFMLKEKYQFTTGQGAAQQISNVEIDNQNQHIFGIANVSVSFDHQLSRSVSVGVQPFAKLPLTGIGYGDASLKSAGLSFSLNIGLFPAKKPGKYAAVRY